MTTAKRLCFQEEEEYEDFERTHQVHSQDLSQDCSEMLTKTETPNVHRYEYN